MDVCSTVFRMNGLLTLIVTNMKIGVNPLDNKKKLQSSILSHFKQDRNSNHICYELELRD